MNTLVWKHTEDIDREKEERKSFTETKQQDKRHGGTKPHVMFGGKTLYKIFLLYAQKQAFPFPLLWLFELKWECALLTALMNLVSAYLAYFSF